MPSSSLSKNAGEGARGGGDVALEVTVLSAESLRLPPSYSLLPRRLRPYVSLSCSASASRTGVDEAGGGDPSWSETVVVPVGAAFLAGGTDVHVSVLSEGGRLAGPTLLGWCKIPASDVLDGLRPAAALRRLSYSLRCPRYGGCGGHGVIHLGVRVVGRGAERLTTAAAAVAPQPGWCGVAIGIPVSTACGAAAAGSAVGTPWPWGGPG